MAQIGKKDFNPSEKCNNFDESEVSFESYYKEDCDIFPIV